MDRNFAILGIGFLLVLSLSVRRAWIEMSVDASSELRRQVALRKESVDRNQVVWVFLVVGLLSLSVRRAWIEICNYFRI